MKKSCVCCQAAAQKASGVNANLVLLFTIGRGEIPITRVVDGLCKKHGVQLARMIAKDRTAEERAGLS